MCPPAGELAGDASQAFTATLYAGGQAPRTYQGMTCLTKDAGLFPAE